ncbi:hypothetical protein [Desulforudis sp. DRI-14]|uniref:hypothetical protein n=1 Tax=Desulforudis sp. DRI-14 TaxID=3459793 RepID=UPI0040419612
MPRILIVSVGGSCDPVINVCKEFQPDFIFFFCSKGSATNVNGVGNPCEKTQVNPRGETIANRLGLSAETYEIVEVDDPDDLKGCYKSVQTIERIIADRFDPNTEVTVNYTGGTKTMSVALALSAVLRDRWELSVNKGPRGDLVKVRGGDIPILADKLEITLDIHLHQVRGHLGRYAYDAADETLAQITATRRLGRGQQESLLRLRRLCQAFQAWDLFDHRRALELLRAVGGGSIAP